MGRSALHTVKATILCYIVSKYIVIIMVNINYMYLLPPIMLLMSFQATLFHDIVHTSH